MFGWTLQEIPIKSLKDHAKNPRQINKDQLDRLQATMDKFGLIDKPIVNKDMTIIGGHQRVKILKKQKVKTVQCWVPEVELNEKEMDELCISLNLHRGEWDWDILANQWDTLDLLEYGFTEEQLTGDTKEEEESQSPKGNMKETFGYTPFSIFDTRTKDWQDRRRYWTHQIGIVDLEGRDKHLIDTSSTKRIIENKMKESSSFDPMLAEIIYSWYVPPNGKILDPFAGGVTRGCVASVLKFHYTGVDIRQEQIDSNINSFIEINDRQPEKLNQPNWICGDSLNIDVLTSDKFDFVFSCPPYGDLETYSDLPGDISNKSYTEFLDVYRKIIKKSCQKLNNNSFSCFVVGEIRDKKGNYHSFVPDTIQAFRDAGLCYYNEAILVNSVGTWPLRAGKFFEGSRKLGKHHQNILIFVKGDAKTATQKLGTPVYSLPEIQEAEEEASP